MGQQKLEINVDQCSTKLTRPQRGLQMFLVGRATKVRLGISFVVLQSESACYSARSSLFITSFPFISDVPQKCCPAGFVVCPV